MAAWQSHKGHQQHRRHWRKEQQSSSLAMISNVMAVVTLRTHDIGQSCFACADKVAAKSLL